MKIFLLLALLFLSACQSALIRDDNSYIEISSQTTIEITQTIEVSPNSARAFFQNGELIKPGQLNLYDVNCEIEINTVSETYQQIEASVFNVISVAQEESPIVENLFLRKNIKVASLNYAWASDSPVDIKRYYHFKLSEKALDDNRSDSNNAAFKESGSIKTDSKTSNSSTVVRAIICRGAQDTPYNAKLPSYEEMKVAAGKYLKFNL